MFINAQQMKISKLTYTFQIIKYNFHKNVNCRAFSCQNANINPKSKCTNGSAFLVQFMKNENCKQSFIIASEHESYNCHGRRSTEKNKIKTRPSPTFQPQHLVHSFDPIFATVKTFAPTSDDILVAQDESELADDDNVISRNNYQVSVLSSRTLFTDFEKSIILNMVKRVDDVKSAKHAAENKVWSGGRAKPEHLEKVFNTLSHNLPRFFVEAHDYSIYTAEIEFNNNIRGTRSKGLAAYMQQLALVRIMGHFKFAHVRFEVLKITKHPDDDTIRVRWRIRGITAFKAFFKVLSIKHWDKKKLMDEESDWYDGFSIFYIGENGLVHRHDCEKMIPDKENKIESRGSLAAKLALIVGALQWPSLEDVNTVVMALLKEKVFQAANSPSQSIVK